MKALVTGHRGLIGSHVTAALVNAGYTVRGVDIAQSVSASERWIAAEDVRDWFRRFIFGGEPFDLVVHCAASVAGVDQRNSPAHLVNLEIDAALWQWAERTRPGRVVYFSSSCAYPVVIRVADGYFITPMAFTEDLIDERFPARPDGLYGWGKLTGEVMAQSAGCPVTIVRPFSVYGPPEAMRDGFAVRSFAEQVRERKDPVEVWGDASQIRDFIHVDDVAAAVLALVDHGVNGPVNLGTGRGTSLAELLGILGRANGYEPSVKVNEGMPAGVHSLVADVTRLTRYYTPKVTLEDYAREVFG